MRYSLILLPCNTYTTLNAEQRRQVLELVRTHLTPRGLFSTSIPNSAYLRSLPKTALQEIEEVFPHPVDAEPVQVSSAWRRTTSQFIISWTYDHLLPDGRVDRFTYQVSQNILPVAEVVKEFRSAGLQVKKLYGDFDLSPLSEESLYQIVVAAPAMN
jgi:hypothetical protein